MIKNGDERPVKWSRKAGHQKASNQKRIERLVIKRLVINNGEERLVKWRRKAGNQEASKKKKGWLSKG